MGPIIKPSFQTYQKHDAMTKNALKKTLIALETNFAILENKCTKSTTRSKIKSETE